MKICRVHNSSRGVLVASEVEVAESAWRRMKGLLGYSAREFPFGKGLWISPSQGIHTIGMVFPIDVVYLNSGGRVVRLYHELAPLRVAALDFRARSVLELPAGTLRATGTAVGDVLELQ